MKFETKRMSNKNDNAIKCLRKETNKKIKLTDELSTKLEDE